MMNFNEMDERQKKAYTNIKYAARDIIRQLENTLSDEFEYSEKYMEAEAILKSHEELVDIIYKESINIYHKEGLCGFGPQYRALMKDIKLCGKQWLMEAVENRVCEEGY